MCIKEFALRIFSNQVIGIVLALILDHIPTKINWK